ncbi:uncharacterized protein K441DRAFT_565764 [Cenococcum geophilum 1.58]|uniref:uncharacterized protein n=1 Tax=Cenococcum geophilum 1.58 TaxID=794803 RepID=UPI00358F9108|nr:hypothetical protein K441DRAFT_565764 [Cenococcum geophilum 1.58]
MSTPDNPTLAKPQTLYFGYGSNLWLHQMQLRCPTSQYLGVARLSNYRWIINDRGYANVVERGDTAEAEAEAADQAAAEASNSSATAAAAAADAVYGLIYSLLPPDEARLDVNEGVPEAYTKETLGVDFWASEPRVEDGWVDVSRPAQGRDVLVYIDRKRVAESRPRREYVFRMNMGIRDAVRMGVPGGYVDGVMRKFIPDEGEGREKGEVETVAMKQALNFADES